MPVTAWYFRLFYIYLVSFGLSFLLFFMVRAVRMQSKGKKNGIATVYWIVFAIGLAVMWFNSFRLDAAFWIGLFIIVFAQIVYGLGYAAMREHPHRKQKVVDWGIYAVSRHSHLLAGDLVVLGIVIMGWNPGSLAYLLLWVFFIAYLVFTHVAMVTEEKTNLDKFGPAYREYMEKVPRYFWPFK